MKTLVVVAGSLLFALTAASSAQAQGVAPAQPDAVRLQLAREILSANGGAQAMEGRMRAVFASVLDLTKASLPNADSKASAVTEALLKYFSDEEIKAIPQLIDQTATIYANNLSEKELRDMLAWSVSPSGQAIQAKMPAISQQLVAAQGPLMRKVISGAMTTAVDRVCADAKCTDDQRKTITATVQKSLSPS